MGLWRVEKIIGGDGVGVDGTEVVVGEGRENGTRSRKSEYLGKYFVGG